MKKAFGLIALLVAAMLGGGCHSIYHVRDIRPASDGKVEVEKCEYYINGFWGTGGYEGCRVETLVVK